MVSRYLIYLNNFLDSIEPNLRKSILIFLFGAVNLTLDKVVFARPLTNYKKVTD